MSGKYHQELQLFVLFRPKKPIPSKKYGCDMIRFTRSGEQALHCSMKVDGKEEEFRSFSIEFRLF